MTSYHLAGTASHHLLRRRARAACARLNHVAPTADVHYAVARAERGPWRWRVEEWRR